MSLGPLTCYRLCNNANGETLRTDTVTMVEKSSTLAQSHTAMTWKREVATSLSPSPLVGDNTISTIQVIGNFDSKDSSSDGYNYYYNWVAWTAPAVRINLSDLPQIGDTV